MKLLLFLILGIVLNFTSGSRILFLSSSFSRSHVIIAQSLAELLAERGHDVTIVSQFPMNKNIQNLREIKSPLPKGFEEFSSTLFNMSKLNAVSNVRHMLGMIDMMTLNNEEMMEMPEFKAILNEKFDLLVIGFFMNEMFLGYSHHFNCPSMMVSANAAIDHINRIFGNPFEANAVPQLMMQFKGEMSFWRRIANFLSIFVYTALSEFWSYKQKVIYE